MKFRKIPVEVEAVEWKGFNGTEIDSFMGVGPSHYWEHGGLYIKTLEGTHHASMGDWIVRGIQGEFYPCKPDIFSETYEPVEDSNASTEGAQTTLIEAIK